MPTGIAEPDDAMLQVDVTQSCRSANSSGVQVVTRKLYRALTGHVQVEPLAWDPLLKCYARLSPSEKERMENPFPANYRPTERPNKKDNPPWTTFSRSVFRLSRRIKWKDLGSPGKAMLFPEVFRDARTRTLPKRLVESSRTSAIFYDAYVLKEPKQTPPEHSSSLLQG